MSATLGLNAATPYPHLSTEASVDGADRRLHRRFGVLRAGKILRRTTGRFDAFKTCDVSLSGVLVEARITRPMVVGEEISLGIAAEPEFSPQMSMIPSDELPAIDSRSSAGVLLREARMIRGVIVRAGRVDEYGVQRVAVAFAGRNEARAEARQAA